MSEDAIYLERVLCGEAGGWQDQIAAAYGGFNRIDFSNHNFYVSPIIISPDRRRQLYQNLMLFFTGFSRFSADIQKQTKRNLKEKTHHLLEMKSLVDDAENILVDKRKNLDEFGRLLDYTWKLKREINSKISTNIIDSIYSKAIHAGAIGGKLLGAGGGGFLLFYVPVERQKSVMNELADLLYVPFEFESDGSQIIYYAPEEYPPKNVKEEMIV